MTKWQTVYPSTLRETLITRGLSPLIAIGLAGLIVYELARAGKARK